MIPRGHITIWVRQGREGPTGAPNIIRYPAKRIHLASNLAHTVESILRYSPKAILHYYWIKAVPGGQIGCPIREGRLHAPIHVVIGEIEFVSKGVSFRCQSTG